MADIYSKEMVHWKDEDNNKIEMYTKWQIKLFEHHIGQKILEIGAGEGRITSLLSAIHSYQIYVAIEPAKLFYNILYKKCKHSVDVLNSTINEISTAYNNQFDTVFSIHVLEHIEDDLQFLKDSDRFLKSEGKIIIMVPALNFLMSELDKNIGHYRRYDKKRMRELSQKLGYKIISCKYSNFIGIFGWWWFCKMRKTHYQTQDKKTKFFKLFKIFNNFFLPVISLIEKVIPVPLGLNLTVVFQKER